MAPLGACCWLLMTKKDWAHHHGGTLPDGICAERAVSCWSGAGEHRPAYGEILNPKQVGSGFGVEGSHVSQCHIGSTEPRNCPRVYGLGFRVHLGCRVDKSARLLRKMCSCLCCLLGPKPENAEP